jgi:iron-sulfur cluster assembly 1
MALPRIVCPLVTSSSAWLPTAARAYTGRCVCSRRVFSACQGTRRLSARRDMQTATAYRPEALADNFAPPRNAGIPDTSIATDAAWDKADTMTGDLTSHLNQERTASISVGEGEAQQSKPVEFTTANRSTSTSGTDIPKPRRSKLRPRKAAMTLTPIAIDQLRRLLSQPNPKMIRVGVKNRGCSGLAYHLEYVEKPGNFDEVVEQDGVKVLIDSKALFSIIGSEMDWQEDKLSRRFIFRNPNISK